MSNGAAFELTLNSKKEVVIKKLSKEEVDRLQKESYFYKGGIPITFKLKENDIDDLSIIERALRKMNNFSIEETEIKDPFIYSNVSFFIYCLENKKIPEDIDYNEVNSLRIEAKQKLSQIRPISVGQASRISGVSPADISVLLIWLAQNK